MKLVPIKISAGISGFESPASEYSQMNLSLDELLVDHPSSMWLGVASGESMTGSGIYDGDLLLIDRAEEAKTGNVVAVNFNGEFVVKVIDIENRMLHSTNPAVRPVYINDLDVCTIEGVVTSSVRLHKPRWLISSGADA